MDRDHSATAPLEPLDQALARAAAGLRAQPLPAGLERRVAAGWAGLVPPPAAAAGAAAGGPLAAPGRGPGAAGVAGAGPGAPGWPSWQRWLAGSGAMLCGVALMLSLLLMLTAPPPADLDGDLASAAVDAGARGRSTGFIPVVSPQRLGELARPDAGPAWLVPGEWPRERLAALGLPFDPARAGESVRAELLVHASGDVLAVRVLAQ